MAAKTWPTDVTKKETVKTTDSTGTTVAKGSIPRASQPSLPQWYSSIRKEGLNDAFKKNPTGTYKDQVIALPENNFTGMTKKQNGTSGGSSYNPYIEEANSLYDQLMNRGPFRYDLQGDMLYRQYADQYTQLGKQAMMDTMGTASGLTGGYGNSYAQLVGNQAYQQYLTQLNSMIPDFYDRAYQAWLDEGDALLSRYELARALGGSMGSAAGSNDDETAGSDLTGILGLPNAATISTAGAMPEGITLTPDYIAGLTGFLNYDLYDLYGQ